MWCVPLSDVGSTPESRSGYIAADPALRQWAQHQHPLPRVGSRRGVCRAPRRLVVFPLGEGLDERRAHPADRDDGTACGAVSRGAALAWRDVEKSYLVGGKFDAGPMAWLRGASITVRIVLGSQQGRGMFVLQTRAARAVGPPAKRHADVPTPAGRRTAMIWTQRLKRVFHIDIETCTACGGALRVTACIGDPAVIGKILTHLDATTAEANALRRPLCRAPPNAAASIDMLHSTSARPATE